MFLITRINIQVNDIIRVLYSYKYKVFKYITHSFETINNNIFIYGDCSAQKFLYSAKDTLHLLYLNYMQTLRAAFPLLMQIRKYEYLYSKPFRWQGQLYTTTAFSHYIVYLKGVYARAHILNRNFFYKNANELARRPPHFTCTSV